MPKRKPAKKRSAGLKRELAIVKKIATHSQRIETLTQELLDVRLHRDSRRESKSEAPPAKKTSKRSELRARRDVRGLTPYDMPIVPDWIKLEPVKRLLKTGDEYWYRGGIQQWHQERGSWVKHWVVHRTEE